MTTTFDDEFDIEDNYLDPNNDDDLDKIIRILQKTGSQRTKSELKSLYLLLKQVEFLKGFWANKPPQVCFALLRSLKYDHTQKAHAVFHFGDPEKYFYMILKGSVFVIIPAKEEKKEEREAPPSLVNCADLDMSDERPLSRAQSPDISSIAGDRTQRTQRKSVVFCQDENPLHKKSSHIRESISRPNLNILSPKTITGIVKSDNKLEDVSRRRSSFYMAGPGILPPESIPLLYPHNTIVNQLKEKDYFGDIALKLHTKRTATIVAREFCHFMILDTRAFNTIIRRYQEDEQREMLTFFKTTSLTKDWPYSSLVGLMRHFKTVRFARNHVIYKFGDPIESIYFVKQGEVEIIKETEIDLQQDPVYLKNGQRRSSISYDKVNLLAMNNMWKKKQHEGTKQQLRVAILGYQQSFGEEEFFKKSQVRQSKAVVKTNNAEIISIPVSKLFENAKDPEQFKNLLSTKNAKTKWRESFEHEIVETSQAQILSTEELNKKKKSRTMSTVFINNMSGFKKQSSRSPKFSEKSYNPEVIQPGTVNRLMQHEFEKKIPSKDFLNRLKNPKHRKNVKSLQSSRTIKSSEEPEQSKPTVVQTFRGESPYIKSIMPPHLISGIDKNILAFAKSTSVSKVVSPTESTNALDDIPTGKNSHYSPTPLSGNLKYSGRMTSTPAPYLTENNRIDTRLQSLESPGLSPLLTPLQYSAVTNNKTKMSNFVQNDLSRQALNERLGIKKLFIDDFKPATSHRIPLQFYVNTPKTKPTEEAKETKESLTETFSSLFQPKIKVNTGSPRLITKIKNHMKSFQSPTSVVPTETVTTHRTVEISKLNKLVNSGPKNRTEKYSARLSPEFFLG